MVAVAIQRAGQSITLVADQAQGRAVGEGQLHVEIVPRQVQPDGDGAEFGRCQLKRHGACWRYWRRAGGDERRLRRSIRRRPGEVDNAARDSVDGRARHLARGDTHFRCRCRGKAAGGIGSGSLRRLWQIRL